MKLIDADMLTPDTEWDDYEDGFISYSKVQIESAMIKPGHWIQTVFWDFCSECKERFEPHQKITEYPYCPKCGRPMKGEKDHAL